MNFNMRSGYSQDTENQYQQQYIKDIMIIIGIFTKDAMSLASLYCLHSGRNSVTKEDIEMALKTRAFHGDTFWNKSDIQQQITEMGKFLDEPGSDSEEEYESEYESDYEYDSNEDEGEMSEIPDEMEIDQTSFIKSECTCDLCTTLNGIKEKWNTWNPYERNEISIKNSINQTFAEQTHTNNL